MFGKGASISMWESSYARRVGWMKSSAIRDLLKITQYSDFISFAGGLPAPELFPVEQVAQVTQQILTERGQSALQYGPTEGYQPLREWIAQYVSQGNIKISPDNVLLTTGSQQALDLLGRIFLDEGDSILVDAPTYLGALQAWSPCGVRYQAIPTDSAGQLQLAQLEDILRTHPKWMYTMPNFQNPTGLTLGLEYRQQLMELTARYAVPVLEDDPYYALRFEGQPLPSLLHLAAHLTPEHDAYNGHCIYLGTFSKTVSPGLRVGWIIAPTPVISKLVQAKQGVDLHSSTFNQMIVDALVRTDFLTPHIERIRSTYAARRDCMLDAMQKCFPDGVTWTTPQGGMFLWVTLPQGIDTSLLLAQALEYRVAFVPGVSFYPDSNVTNTLRLNFSNASPENIRAGIDRLGQLFSAAFAKLDVSGMSVVRG